MNRVLKIIHASYAYERGIYGSGIPVAILDTGVYPHQAVRDRILSFHDFVGEQTWNAYLRHCGRIFTGSTVSGCGAGMRFSYL